MHATTDFPLPITVHNPERPADSPNVPADRLPRTGGRVASVANFLQRHPLLAAIGLVIAVLAAYFPALDAQFLWDDEALVFHNLLIRSPLFCLEAFRHTLFFDASNFFRPTQTLTYIADYWFWDLLPYGYHLTNILIHGANGFLLFLLLSRLLPALCPALRVDGEEKSSRFARLPAFVLAGLWALHPVHSAAVAYVSGRADSLAMLCCVGAWLLVERAREAGSTASRVAFAAGASASFFLGLGSKEIAFVWLALFACYHVFFFQPTGRGKRFEWTALAGSFVVLGLYVLLRRSVPMPASRNVMPEHSAIEMALRALGDYGSLMVFPVKLLMERQVYPSPKHIVTPEDQWFYQSLTLGGVLLVAVLAAGFCWRGKGQKLRRFGVCWFFCGFLPVSNLFVTINAAVAEHWLYLPSIGLLLFAAGCAVELSTRRLRVMALATASLLMAALGVRTYWRAFDWMDEMTFYRQTINAGGDLPRARMGMANAFTHRHDDAAAIDLLRKVAADAPGFVLNQINLGNALLRHGDLDQGRAILEHALSNCEKEAPRTVLIIVTNLDKVEQGQEWKARRSETLASLHARFTDSWDLVRFDAEEARRNGTLAAAVPALEEYARAHWWHYSSRQYLGSVLLELGRKDEAVASLVAASRLDVHDADALSTAAGIRSEAGRFAEAEKLQARAVARQPDSPRQRLLLSHILEGLGQSQEAARQVNAATALLAQTPAAVLP